MINFLLSATFLSKLCESDKVRHFIKYRGTEITQGGFRAAAPVPKLILKKRRVFLDTVTSELYVFILQPKSATAIS